MFPGQQPPGPARQSEKEKEKQDENGGKKGGNAPAPARKKFIPKKSGGSDMRLPKITPHARCKLKLLRTERVKDFLALEKEFISSMEAARPTGEQREARAAAERRKVDALRGCRWGRWRSWWTRTTRL